MCLVFGAYLHRWALFLCWFGIFKFRSVPFRVYVCLWEWNRLHLHGKVIRLDMQDHRIQLIIQQFSIITLRLFDSQRFFLVDFIHPNRIFHLFASMLPFHIPKNEYRSPNNECGYFTGEPKRIYIEIYMFWFSFLLSFGNEHSGSIAVGVFFFLSSLGVNITNAQWNVRWKVSICGPSWCEWNRWMNMNSIVRVLKFKYSRRRKRNFQQQWLVDTCDGPATFSAS